MTNRPLTDVVRSDINYFQKKLNKYINKGVTLKKELKELRKNATQNIDSILKKSEYLENINNTIERHERILGYLKVYVEKEFGEMMANKGVNMWFLDRIAEKDKEYYDKIFNEYKTAYYKAYGKNRTFTDEEIRDSLKYSLELAYTFKADFVYELNGDDVIMDNLDQFTEYCSENIAGLL